MTREDIIFNLNRSTLDCEVIETVLNLLSQFAEAIETVWERECCCYNHEDAFFKAVQYLYGEEIKGNET